MEEHLLFISLVARPDLVLHYSFSFVAFQRKPALSNTSQIKPWVNNDKPKA